MSHWQNDLYSTGQWANEFTQHATSLYPTQSGYHLPTMLWSNLEKYLQHIQTNCSIEFGSDNFPTIYNYIIFIASLPSQNGWFHHFNPICCVFPLS